MADKASAAIIKGNFIQSPLAPENLPEYIQSVRHGVWDFICKAYATPKPAPNRPDFMVCMPVSPIACFNLEQLVTFGTALALFPTAKRGKTTGTPLAILLADGAAGSGTKRRRRHL
jgi:hypothetical protein